ncbi:MAG: UbiA family prenyltransferase [Candidatus Rokuibacteriota bacterium]
MARWLRYLIERSPPAVVGVVAAGIALSGLWIGGGAFDSTGFGLALAGLVLFMVLARLADELKDYEKDEVAHPERPLPRGLVTPNAVRHVMRGLFAAMGAYAVVLMLATGWLAAALYAASAFWLWLMSEEFFADKTLAPRPLVSALLHQLVLFPLYGFAVAVREPQLALASPGLAYALANLGASMSYEVGRKLDPAAHPVLGYYGTRYGGRRCALIIAGFTIVAAAGAWWLGAGTVLWPVEALVVAAVLGLFVRPDMHRPVERVAALSVLVHVWSVPIRRAVEWLG